MSEGLLRVPFDPVLLFRLTQMVSLEGARKTLNWMGKDREGFSPLRSINFAVFDQDFLSREVLSCEFKNLPEREREREKSRAETSDDWLRLFLRLLAIPLGLASGENSSRLRGWNAHAAQTSINRKSASQVFPAFLVACSFFWCKFDGQAKWTSQNVGHWSLYFAPFNIWAEEDPISEIQDPRSPPGAQSSSKSCLQWRFSTTG